MTQRAPARRRPAVAVAPRSAVIQSDKEARASGGFTTFWESATQEILAVTYWFDPAPRPRPYPVTVRFSGRRVDVKGRLQAGDKFVHPGRNDRAGRPRQWPDLTHGPCPRHQCGLVGRDNTHVGGRSPCAWAARARERSPRDWTQRTGRSVVAQVGAGCFVGRTGENVFDPPCPCAGDPSWHLGSNGDAWHGGRAGAPGADSCR